MYTLSVMFQKSFKYFHTTNKKNKNHNTNLSILRNSQSTVIIYNCTVYELQLL